MYVISLCGGFRSIQFFGKLNKIVGNVVKDMLLNKGTKGTKAKKLGKRVHYFNQMIFKDHHLKVTSEDISSGDLKKDIR